MLNRVILQGRLTADPELKQTASGTDYCRFTIACERDFKPEGKDRDSDFISCTVWRKSAEFLQKYFSKGDMVLLSGRIQTGKYDDNGTTRYTTDVIVDSINFCGSKRDKPERSTSTSDSDDKLDKLMDEFPIVEDDGDLPF